MQKIISLDIGSYSIKAVEILNHFKSYEISNFYENVIPQIDELSPDIIIPNCMGQIFQENNLNADRIITAMPGQYISSRVIPFNFSDPHKIMAAVNTEIEDMVPFNMEDMLVDHQILGSTEGKTATLVVMTKKNFLASFLDHLNRIDIDPKLVDVDSLSFYNLCPYLEMEAGKVYGIVDVGHEKTSVCIVKDGILRMFRSINLGGRFLTEFLARDLEVGFNQAQIIKHDVSYIITDNNKGNNLGKKEKVAADRITIAANAIVKELGRTLYAFKTWEKTPVDRIYLSGGTSLIENFDQYLTENLEVETVHSQLEEGGLKINQNISSRMPTMVQGLAIGLRAVTSVKRHSQINLRKGEFAYVQDYESALKSGGLVFKLLSVVLLLFTISYVSKYFIYDSQITKLQALYKNEFLSSFPNLKKKYRGDKIPFVKIKRDATSMLDERINARKDSIASFISANSDSGSLVVLKDISESLPKDIEVNVVEYRYTTQPDGSGQIRIRVEADSFETIAKFQDSLKKVEVLDNIVEKSSDTKPGSDIKVAIIETNYIKQEI